MARRPLRKFHVKPPGRPNSSINVTPLVDVVLVLLIIFMVLTPLLDKMLRLRVPDAEQEQNEEPPTNQLVVSLSPTGEISINSEKVTNDAYVDKLRRVLAAKAPGDRLVFFSSDDKAPYPQLVHVLDGARQAGAEILTMTTEPMTAAPVAPTTPPGPAAPPTP
jgi:biopolymer transport protein ExbD